MPEDYGYKKWELSTLPIIPENFKLFPLKGYGNQIKMLGELINRDDVSEVINACDAGRDSVISTIISAAQSLSSGFGFHCLPMKA